MDRPGSSGAAAEEGRADGVSLVDRIRESWSEILGIDAVEPDDDFFELGGHSLIAASAVSRLSERLGISVPPDALFDAPTAREMADLIAELRGRAEGDVSADVTPFHPSWVVPLQREGRGRPVFVFPAGRDEIRALAREARLAALVGRDHPFWGLRRDAAPLDAARENGLPALAAEYARQMRRLQPEGPFLLFGICVGGYFAWETARHLLAMGEEVAGVLFFEVPLRPDFDQVMPGVTPFHVTRPWRLDLHYRPVPLPVDLTHLMTDAWEARGWWGPWREVVRGAHDVVAVSVQAPDGHDPRQWRYEILSRHVRAWIERSVG